MPINKPFYLNYRNYPGGFVQSDNAEYSSWGYVIDSRYANSPSHYVKAFLLIQSDLQKLFEFVEPSDNNLKTYSYRIHELFIRTCIEIEANFKSILKANIYNPKNNRGKEISEKSWNISNYKIINKTHRLSSYTVHVPFWTGGNSSFRPFESWANASSKLDWYQSYNSCKHDRTNNFDKASFENLLKAVSGLLVLLSSQFGTQDFSPASKSLSLGNSYNYLKTEPAIGSFFHITFPNDWPYEEQYDFNWENLKNEQNPFQQIDYNSLESLSTPPSTS